LVVDIDDPEHFWCRACGAWGDVLDFVGLVHGVSYLAGQYRLLTGAELQSRIDPKYAEEILRAAGARRRDEIEGAVAPDDLTDEVYGALLDGLTLSDRHRDSVVLRGFEDAALTTRRIKSLAAGLGERVRLCERLAGEGYDLDMIPGFFRVPADSPDAWLRGRWCVGYDGAGVGREAGSLLVPIRNPFGKIARLMIYDDPPARAKGVWPSAFTLSSPGRYCASGGAAGVARVHFAGPEDGGTDPGALYIVDGALTAEIVARDWGVRVAGLPGLGRCVDEALEEARKFSTIDVVIDGADNPHVDALCYKAHALGLQPLYHFWNYKRGGTFNAYLMSGPGEAVSAGALAV
jgi:hypothetical protein